MFTRVCDWTRIAFSNDGKQILISTNGGMIRVLNAFSGAVLHTFSVRDSQAEIQKSLNLILLIMFFSFLN